MTDDPSTKYPRPPTPEEPQSSLGSESAMSRKPDHGEHIYKGSGKLTAARPSSPGQTAASAVRSPSRARVRMCSSAFSTKDDAEETAHWAREAGRRAVLKPGAAIVNTTSVNTKTASKQILVYAASKAAILNLTVGLSELLAEKGICVNAVAPGPIWTPLPVSTMPPDKVEDDGANVPLKRAGQPAELAGAYVHLASDDSTDVTGAFIPVTGGKLML